MIICFQHFSPVKDILPNEKSYLFSDICAMLFVRSVTFFSACKCFDLFEVTFYLKFSVFHRNLFFFTISAKSVLVAKFSCSNLAAKLPAVKLLNSCVVIYLL